MRIFNSFGLLVSKIKNGCTKQCIINAFENMKKSKKQQRVAKDSNESRKCKNG